MNKLSIILLSIILSCLGLQAQDTGEILYNGIELPSVWPPRNPMPTVRKAMDLPYLDNIPSVIPIDKGRQLFFDDFLIEETTMERTFHQPNYYANNPIIEPDQEWEKTAKGTPYANPFSDGVWYDEVDKKFKIWYLTGGSIISDEKQVFITSYAESEDGKTWIKPELDIVEGTNVVDTLWRDASSIWIDKQEIDPDKRYKMFQVCFFNRDRRWRMYLRYSKDGIHWGDAVAQSGDLYDRTSVFHNPFRDKWCYSIKTNSPLGRARQYLESDDAELGTSLIHRVNGQYKDRYIVDWFTADDKETRNPDYPEIEPQIYSHDAIAYESVMLGYFTVWQGPENNVCDSLKIQKRNEVCMGYSRDGFHWDKPDHTPFLGVDHSEGAWNWGNIQSVIGCPIIVGDSMYFYVSGRRLNPSMWDGYTSTGLGILRRDGFVSMQTAADATLTTREVQFSGSYLFVNADVNAGEIKVEVLDANGDVIKGYSKKDCISYSDGSSTKQRITWKKKDDLADLSGQNVKFKFYVSNGAIYSFWVSEWETGESKGYTGGGGPGLHPSGVDVK